MITVQLKQPILIEGQPFHEVTVFVSHKVAEVVQYDKVSQRHTIVEITAGEHSIAKGVSHCFEPDNFSRSEGRRRAVASCFRHDRLDKGHRLLTLDNRQKIFDAVCPEFTQLGAKKRLKIAINALQQIVNRGGPIATIASDALREMHLDSGIAVAKNPVVTPLQETAKTE